VKVGSPSRRVSKASAQFFLDWVRERMGQIKFADPRQQDEVAQPHRRAEQFWLERVVQANAELLAALAASDQSNPAFNCLLPSTT